jgi:hypothetical protein
VLEPAGDEAILPTGSVLVDPAWPSRNCFVVLEGEATIVIPGRQPRTVGEADYVGDLDPAGLPTPLRGATVIVQAPSRVLVLDANRLATRIRSDHGFAAAWQAWTARHNSPR